MLKTWRSVPVEGVDERKIEEYLKKHNITAMQNIEIKKVRFLELKLRFIVISHNLLETTWQKSAVQLPQKIPTFVDSTS